MKNRHIFCILTSIVLTANAVNAQNNSGTPPILRTAKDTASWVTGESYARSYLNTHFTFDTAIIIQAFVHTLHGGQQPVDEERYQQIYQELTLGMQLQQRKHQQLLYEQAEKNENEFFAELVKSHPNVRQAPQGFYYEIIQQGTGKHVELNKRASFDYRGYMMLSGDTIDQTYGKRDPILTVVNDHLFPGLNTGIQMMSEGSIYRFYFPCRLAFGAKGSQSVPPYTPVIYDVEVHKVYDD